MTNKAEEVRLALKLREAFAVFTQGVSIYFYDVTKRAKYIKCKKELWLDPDTLRLCVANAQNTNPLKPTDDVPTGLYLRDISKVQKGASAYVFQCHRAYLLRHSNSHEPVVGPASECCFSIIGSECCLSFEVPSQEVRDWFVERLDVLSYDILSEEEAVAKAHRLQSLSAEFVFPPVSDGPQRVPETAKTAYLENPLSVSLDDAQDPTDISRDKAIVDPASSYAHLKALLTGGIEVVLHHDEGHIFSGILSYEDPAEMNQAALMVEGYELEPEVEVDSSDDEEFATDADGNDTDRRRRRRKKPPVRKLHPLGSLCLTPLTQLSQPLSLTMYQWFGSVLHYPIDLLMGRDPSVSELLNEPIKIPIADVVDVRSHSHSYGFLMTSTMPMFDYKRKDVCNNILSESFGKECFTVVGSRGTFNIKLSNEAVRNMFVDKLCNFIKYSQAAAALTNLPENLSEDVNSVVSSENEDDGYLY